MLVDVLGFAAETTCNLMTLKLCDVGRPGVAEVANRMKWSELVRGQRPLKTEKAPSVSLKLLE